MYVNGPYLEVRSEFREVFIDNIIFSNDKRAIVLLKTNELSFFVKYLTLKDHKIVNKHSRENNLSDFLDGKIIKEDKFIFKLRILDAEIFRRLKTVGQVINDEGYYIIDYIMDINNFICTGVEKILFNKEIISKHDNIMNTISLYSTDIKKQDSIKIRDNIDKIEVIFKYCLVKNIQDEINLIKKINREVLFNISEKYIFDMFYDKSKSYYTDYLLKLLNTYQENYTSLEVIQEDLIKIETAGYKEIKNDFKENYEIYMDLFNKMNIPYFRCEQDKQQNIKIRSIDCYDDSLFDDQTLDEKIESAEFQERAERYKARYTFENNIFMLTQFKENKHDTDLWWNILEANQDLVRKIAMKYINYLAGTILDMDDLITYGNFGLIKAIEGFDPSQGTEFSTYAVYWIQSQIDRYLMNEINTIRIPVHIFERIRKLNRIENDVLEYVDEIHDKYIADELGVRPNKVNELRIIRDTFMVGRLGSLDSAVSDKSDTTALELNSYNNGMLQVIGEESNQLIEDIVCNKLFFDKILQCMQEMLNEREYKIIELRFGLTDNNSHTLEEVGEVFGVTRERIRQIETKVIKKIRTIAVREKWEGYEWIELI